MTVRGVARVHRVEGVDGLFTVRPPVEVATRFRARGWWRDTSVLHDLVRHAVERPYAPAIVARGVAEGRTRVIRYADLLCYVRRFAAALTSLGVDRGDRVAFQLPNWWEAAAMTLACRWAGAIAVPLQITLRSLELERVLNAAQAQLCVVPDSWDGYECAAALEEIAPRLPWLRYRAVYGDRVPPGAVDFAEYFLRTPHEEWDTAPARLPTSGELDQPCVLLFTSGTTGERKAVLHTENTLYAGCGGHAAVVARGWSDGEVFATPLPITGQAGMLYAVWAPVLAGGTGVYQDAWSPAGYLELLAEAEVTQTLMAPLFAEQLMAEYRRRPRPLPSLRLVMCGGTPVEPELVREVTARLGVPLRACWGMTETGMGFRTPEDAPDDRACHSDGAPMPGVETELPPVPGGDGLCRLRVRGAGVSIGFWQPGSGTGVRQPWHDDAGWVETGDLVRPDGRGGIRFASRGDRRLGSFHIIPVAEVEREIMRHPGVREAAIVGHHDAHGHEHLCVAVVASGNRCPSLAELAQILTERGMSQAYLPTMLREVGPALPRTENGKIHYGRLRAMTVDSAAGSAERGSHGSYDGHR
ncbi:AMP-binding protein [Streptomyces sp. 4N509B]|uniref:AMP-binding protein n=1 Tax=Streptomyces sp. 4N509B TaxID=3457413 RepID=UPI003FD441E6